MSEQYVQMIHKKGHRHARIERKGASVVQGWAPHDEKRKYDSEEEAIAAVSAWVKVQKRRGFIDLAEHHRREAAAEPLYEVERDLGALITEGARVGKLRLALREIGRVRITSGRIVACDPFGDEVEPLARRVPTGEHAVFLSIASESKKKGERCAAALVRFGRAAPVKWRSAGKAFGVDSGKACIHDAKAAFDHEPRETLSKLLAAQRGVAFAALGVGPRERHNVLAFSSGLGDGAYEAHWGFGRSGQLCALLIDFRLV